MKKRILSMLLVIVLSVTLLAGCGGKETLEPNGSAPIIPEILEPAPGYQGDAVDAPEAETPAPDTELPEPIVSAVPETEEPAEPSAEPETPADPAVTPEPSAQPTATPEPSAQPSAAPSAAPSATPKPVAPASGAQAILNAASLSPMKTNDAELDAMVESILNRIITDNMTTYEKVKACYDYLMQNTVYQTKSEPTVIRSGVYVSDEDYKVVLLASEVLSTGKGVCDHYAAALHVLTRRIGLESYICTGKHISQKGGLGGHVWTIITVNGTDYIFDAQIDDYNGGKYSRFCKTFAEMGSTYQDYNPAENKAAFSSFQRTLSSSSSSSWSEPFADMGVYTLIDAFVFSDDQMIQYLEESVLYSEGLAWEATQQLRVDAGLPEMTSNWQAVKVACFCAANEAMGWAVPVEEVADYLYMQGVDFRYVTTGVISGGLVEPTELVLMEQELFLNTHYDGVAAGRYEDTWFVILYGG